MKKVLFIPNARERLKDRGIPKELVISILEKPDSLEERYAGRKVAQKSLNGKLIRVIYEERDDEILIITAYITSKVKKYMGVNRNEDHIRP